MDLFPYILLREAGISKHLLSQSPSLLSGIIENLGTAQDTLQNLKKELTALLDHLIEADEPPCIRVSLINIRRAISNNKKVKQKDLEKITTHSFKRKLLLAIEQLKTSQLAFEKALFDFEVAYEKTGIEEAKFLFANKNEPNLLNGLLFSSPQFFNRLQQTNFQPNQFNKKIRQTLLKLLEYLSRGTYKTSPFSSFSKVGFFDLNSRVGLTPRYQNIIYTNGDSNKEILIGLNPTIFKDEENFYYFILQNNIQELIRNPQIEPLITLYNAQNPSDHINQLDNETKIQLIKNGFLIEKSVKHNTLITNQITTIQSIPIENIAHKKSQLEKLKSDLSINGMEQPLIYEDCYLSPKVDLQKPTFEAIAYDLNQLTKILAPLHFFSMREKMFKFFKENIAEDEAINFVELVEAIKELPSDYLAEEIELKKQERQKFQDELLKAINKKNIDNESGVLNFSFKDFDFSKTNVASNYFAAHLQTEIINNKTKAIVNSISNGAGKLFGRFANQYPKVASELKQYIYNNANGDQLMLNQDFSTSPVNSHPPIVDQKIAIPTDTKPGLSPGKLYVSHDTKTKTIYLMNEAADPIKVINLGVEAEQTRNYFYPYLSAFTGTRCVISPFLEIVNNIAYTKYESIYQLPRIEIGDHIVLQRKSWNIPFNAIPIKEKGISDAHYYLKIQEWLKQHNLPKQVFIKTHSKWFSTEAAQKSNVGHKPQFIDFTRIGFVLLFAKKLHQVNDFLEITEVLPNFISNNTTVKEYAIEWYG